VRERSGVPHVRGMFKPCLASGHFFVVTPSTTNFECSRLKIAVRSPVKVRYLEIIIRGV